MADIVKIRAAIFIPHAWLDSPRSEQRSFRGDDREFTPHAVNTGRSRVEQEVVVDLDRELLETYADTGRSKERIERDDGTIDTREGKAETTGIGITDIVWDDGCEFRLRANAANPLVETAKPVTYEVRATVTLDGEVHLAGAHDAYPCFECYAQRDFEPFRPLYTYDYREAGGSPRDLAGPPECGFEVTDASNDDN
jgi:hypothetical protein